MKKVLIFTGGTGGHIIPARTLAQALADNKYKTAIVGDKNLKKYIKFSDKFDSKIISCGQIKSGIKGKISAAVKISLGLIKSLFVILRFRPDTIVSFGGYATFPSLIAAVILRKKIILHEQNATLGKVNRIFAKFAYKIALSFEDTQIEKKFSKKTKFTGIPIRKDIIAIGNQEYNLPREVSGKKRKNMGYSGLILASEYDNFDEYFDHKEPLRILIIGGSGGAEIFSKTLPGAFFNLSEEFKNNIQITQQCRKDLIQQTFNIYEKFNMNIEVDSFFNDMESLISKSHLIISRAGSSSIHEFLVANKPMILVPFAKSADDHQLKNAEIFVKNKAAKIIKEENFNIKNIANILNDLLSKDKALINMSLDSKKYAKKHLKSCENLIKIIDE